MGIQFPPIAFLYLLYLFIYVIHIFVQWYKALLNLNLNLKLVPGSKKKFAPEMNFENESLS